MGTCNSNSKGSKGSGNSGAEGSTEKKLSGIGYKLKAGEEAVVRLAPNWLNKEGQIMVYKNKDGNYVYTGHIDKEVPKTDTKSAEYKANLARNNVKAKFLSNGKVSVSSGGLYAKKKTFKNVEDFKKDVNARLDAKIKRRTQNVNDLKKGILPFSQLQAENIKSDFKNNVSSVAMKKIGKTLHNDLKSYQLEIDAAKDAKRRLNLAFEKY